MRTLDLRLFRDFRSTLLEHREKLPYVAMALVILTVYVISRGRETVRTVYKNEGKTEFKDARILGSSGESIYEGKEKLLTKTVRDIQAAQGSLREVTEKISQRLEQLENGNSLGPNPDVNKVDSSASKVVSTNTATGEAVQIKIHQAPDGIDEPQSAPNEKTNSRRSFSFAIARKSEGPGIISFPVKDLAIEKTESIVVPAGSYVKAKLMTGVEAPEGKTYPVLLQLDYAFIVPNKKRIDLSGCFMIAKSTGDLSIERVQMQTDKLSCVSKTGKMFERDVNGFVTDDKDNSFSVIGSVNSKQDRVAAMAFLSSIVEGIGKALQSAQTTQQTTPLGGAQSVVTGDQMTYIGAGGAATAASMVTQWYLKQAQNLLPTINIGSGQDVWVVMKDTVRLPSDYFEHASTGGQDSVYTYFSRLSD